MRREREREREAFHALISTIATTLESHQEQTGSMCNSWISTRESFKLVSMFPVSNFAVKSFTLFDNSRCLKKYGFNWDETDRVQFTIMEPTNCNSQPNNFMLPLLINYEGITYPASTLHGVIYITIKTINQ
jgi:hypothetical protein